MEDFGLFRGSKSLDYSGLWETEDCISEAKMEKRFNSEGLRYKMNKTEKEASAFEPLFGIGPRVESIWEALGFTATSNNEPLSTKIGSWSAKNAFFSCTRFFNCLQFLCLSCLIIRCCSEAKRLPNAFHPWPNTE